MQDDTVSFLVLPWVLHSCYFLILSGRIIFFSICSNFAVQVVPTCMKEPRFFLGSLDRFLSNWLVFSIPACKVLNKVLICQSCSIIGVHPSRGHDQLPRQAGGPGKQALAPENRYTYAIFVESDLIFSH